MLKQIQREKEIMMLYTWCSQTKSSKRKLTKKRDIYILKIKKTNSLK